MVSGDIDSTHACDSLLITKVTCSTGMLLKLAITVIKHGDAAESQCSSTFDDFIMIPELCRATALSPSFDWWTSRKGCYYYEQNIRDNLVSAGKGFVVLILLMALIGQGSSI